MSIREETVVSVVLNIMAFLMMFGMLYLSSRIAKKKETNARLFGIMCFSVLLIAFSDGTVAACYGQAFAWAPPVLMGLKTLGAAAQLMLVYQWLLYADYRIYGSRDHLTRHYKPVMAASAVLNILFLINLFTGFLFSVDENTLAVNHTVVYTGICILEGCCFLYSLYLLLRFRKAGGSLHFFRIYTILVPIAAALLLYVVTRQSTMALGFSLAIFFLYFSMIDQWRFDDEETGFYNKQYLHWLSEQAWLGKRDFKGRISFETKDDAVALSKILKEELPKGAQMIRLNKGKFLMLAENADRSALLMMKELVEEAVQEYADASETPFSVRTESAVRSKDTGAETFLTEAAKN